MDIKVIPLHELQKDANSILGNCCDTGDAIEVELPDQRRVRIQPVGDDDLVNELIESDQGFRDLLAHSAASPRKPFVPSSGTDGQP